MLFSSLIFLIYFLPIVLIGYYILPKAVKNYWLLILSLAFYAWGAFDFIVMMIIAIIFNYLCAIGIDLSKNERIRKLILILSVMANIMLLFNHKYMNFITGLLHKYISDSIAPTHNVLPIGISFFTFQAMSYVIDVYRKKVPVQKNIYYLGLYISFFPQLIAGPIVRYIDIEKQIENRKTTLNQFCDGVSRFMRGFCSKILFANTFAVIADDAFNQCNTNTSKMGIVFAWIGAISYSMQIYFDFSGYSSMAIGLGKMFGFEFMENFNFPYMAKSITDFWRRWHISLSSWFRDYVYIPLGGSRVNKKWKLYRNLFVVWLLTGIWHGANFTFLIWGLGYFVLLSIEKFVDMEKINKISVISVLYRIYTLVCICLLWVIFRADDLHYAWRYLGILYGRYGNPVMDQSAIKYLIDYKIFFAIAILFCTPIFLNIKEAIKKKFEWGWLIDTVYDFLLLIGLVLSVSSLVMGANNPFIYFNF